MNNEDPQTINLHLEAGVAAEHPAQTGLPFRVAPATADESNTLLQGLCVSACWCVDDLRFAFDSSFVAPEIASELGALAALVKKFPDNPLSIFAHADPVGDDEYNKQLSGRRAIAIYALLTRNVDMWDDLYNHPLGRDNWQESALSTMAQTAAMPYTPPPRFAGDKGGGNPSVPPSANDSGSDGDFGAGCPIFALQTSAPPDAPDAAEPDTPAPDNPPPPADPAKRTKAAKKDPQQRRELFREYMDRLCGPDLELAPEDFLGQGSDPQGKADYQGCSEFNPVLVFSQKEAQDFAPPARHEDRNEENAANRRVLIFFFKKDTVVDPNRWPCPRAKEGTAGCRRRFWSDYKKRLANQPEHREYPKTRDTFACRFYDRLASASPCENIVIPQRFRLYDLDGNFIPNAAWRLYLEGQEPREGVASSRGFVKIRRAPGASSGRIHWGPPGSGDEPAVLTFADEIFLNIDGDPETQANQRLINLGYGGAPLPKMVMAFQVDYEESHGLIVSGFLDEPTKAAIQDVHDGMSDRLKEE